MTDLIESRIKAIKEGKLPEGYKRTKAGIMPVDWDGTIQAKKLFKKHTDKKHDGDLEILAATQERGIVPRSQIGIDIQCSDEGVKGYKKVSKGDFVISLRSFQGGIEYSEYTGIISPAYTVLKPIKDISTGFYRNYFKTDTFIKRLNGAVYGIRDGKQIGYRDFGDMYVHCPPLAEQERIAEILIQCDRVIELKEQKLDELKQLKKEFLRKMFPAKGCDTPEIRFLGFTGAWEQRKLGTVTELLTGFPFESKKFTNDGIKLVRGTNVKRGYLDFSEGLCEYWTSAQGLENYLLKSGDILIQMDGALIGKSYAKIRENQLPALLVQRVTRARVQSNNADEAFVYQQIQKGFLAYIKGTKTETAVPHLSLSDIENFMIEIPSIGEQKQIGAFFEQLDTLITLHQRELEETKTYKKTLAKLLLTGIVRVQG